MEEEWDPEWAERRGRLKTAVDLEFDVGEPPVCDVEFGKIKFKKRKVVKATVIEPLKKKNNEELF